MFGFEHSRTSLDGLTLERMLIQIGESGLQMEHCFTTTVRRADRLLQICTMVEKLHLARIVLIQYSAELIRFRTRLFKF